MTTDAGAPRYEEFLPRADIRSWVRTCWIRSAGAMPVEQRHLPTGGMELHVVLGTGGVLIGPLTVATVDVLPPRATLVGMRFWPGAAVIVTGTSSSSAPRPAEELLDRRVSLPELWGDRADPLLAALAAADGPRAALRLLESYVAGLSRARPRTDPLVRHAAARLMPWQAGGVGELATELAISHSQLRRRFLTSVGLPPKVLQRTLRFQGYLALAQAAASSEGSVRISELAARVGYADQSHLARECLRLTGLTPGRLLGAGHVTDCCGHDHRPSYGPFLGRASAGAPAGDRARSVQSRAGASP